MRGVGPLILTINGGSSSIKFALFEVCEPLRRILHGGIERIGVSGTTLDIKGANTGDNSSRALPGLNYAAAADALIDCVTERAGHDSIRTIGHRVVHGGPRYSAPHRIDAEMIAQLRSLTAFDPEHLPEEIGLIETFRRHFPKLPQIACFDTAFHHDMPRVAQMLAIPRRYEAQGVRRYGFHGLSYTYLMGELARLHGVTAAPGRIVLAHLGNGASLAAVRDGKPIDTSMGFTPAAGVPMGTRSGDLDPGLVAYLAKTEKMGAKAFGEMANFHSGLLGISETSSDMQELLDREATDARAAEAVALFCYQVRKWIGAFVAALGGIGDNAPTVRGRICRELGFLGIDLDQKRNAGGEPLISSDAGRVKVRVIHTDEEIVIANAVAKILASDSVGEP